MACSIGVQGGTSQGGGGGTIAVTLAGITAGSTIGVGVLFSHASTETITGVSDAQGAYAQVAAQKNDTVNTVAVQCWYLKNANSGSHTITASFSGGANGENYIYAIEVKGADTSAPLGTADSGTANTGTALATNATLSGSSGDAILAFGGNESTVETYTKGTTFDALTAQAQMFGETRILAGTVTSFAADASQNASTDWVIQGFTIKAASAGGALTVGEMVAAGAEALENHAFAMAGWQRQHEAFLGDTSHTFVPILPASTTSGIWYNEHLDHPNVQGWVFRAQQADEDQSTNFIILPRPAWDTDADQQKAQLPSYGNLASDGGLDWTQFIILPLRGWDHDADFQEAQLPYQGLPSDQGAEWTNFIVLPPFDPVNTLVESEFFTASQLAQAGYEGIPSDAGQDTTQFLIIPQQVQNLDSEHQLPSLPYQGLASDQGQDWTQAVIIPAFDPSISLVAEAMFEAYQSYQLGSQGFGTEAGADPGSWGNPATNVVVATAVMSYLNRFNPFNF